MQEALVFFLPSKKNNSSAAKYGVPVNFKVSEGVLNIYAKNNELMDEIDLKKVISIKIRSCEIKISEEKGNWAFHFNDESLANTSYSFIVESNRNLLSESVDSDKSTSTENTEKRTFSLHSLLNLRKSRRRDEQHLSLERKSKKDPYKIKSIFSREKSASSHVCLDESKHQLNSSETIENSELSDFNDSSNLSMITNVSDNNASTTNDCLNDCVDNDNKDENPKSNNQAIDESTGARNAPESNERSLLINAIENSYRTITFYLPYNLKHQSIVKIDQTLRDTLENICRLRGIENIQTFIPQDNEENILSLDKKIADLKSPKIYWNVLAEGYEMPKSLLFCANTEINSPGIGNNTSNVVESNKTSSSKYIKKIDDTVEIISTNNNISEDVFSDENEETIDYRTRVAREILKTEKTYVEYLKLLNISYLQSWRAAVGTNGFPALNLVNKCFPKNFELIVNFNDTLYSKLEELILKEKNIDAIGHLFLEYGSFLRMYKEYSSEYHQSLLCFYDLQRDYPAFSAKVEEIRENSTYKNPFEDLIIMPVQRVPRYSLLLGDLFTNTPPENSDYKDLKDAVSLLININEAINESVRKKENMKRIEEFSQKGANFQSLIIPTRFLITDCFIKVKEGKNKYFKQFFLFNDILVSVKEPALKTGTDLSQPEYNWPLNLVWIKETAVTHTIIGPNGAQILIEKKDQTYASFIEKLSSSILKWLSRGKINQTPLESIPDRRIGTFTSSLNDKYDGEWLDGQKDGNGTYTYCGCVYEGKFVMGKQSGKGRLKYPTGEYYVGEWENGLQNGEGSLYTDSGFLIYEGSWQCGLINGQGKLFYKNGDEYIGEFKFGKCHNYGVLSCFNGTKYEGNWKNSYYEGNGKLKTPDGVLYEGTFKGGLKHGTGTCTYQNGSVYVGNFIDGFRSGKGEFKSCDNSTYKGEWLDDIPDGKGLKKSADGVIYEGSWSKGLRKGHGICTFPDGSKYDGNWLDGKRHGKGTLKYVDGTYYSGDWTNGKREGRGTMKFQNGAKYEGFWHLGKFHKSGVYTGGEKENVKCYDGEWEYGLFSGKGVLTLLSGDVFKGNFKDGKIHGTGVWQYANNLSVTGKWNYGLIDGKFNLKSGEEKIDYQGTLEESINNKQAPPDHLMLTLNPIVFWVAPEIPKENFLDF